MKKEKDFGDELYDLMKKHNIPMENAENMINDVVKSIAKPIESALKTELDEHLGYQKNQSSTNSNYRNGYSKKTVKSSIEGKTLLKIPRDREGTFEPKLIKKHQTSINQIERKVIFMYSKGLSNRDISDTIDEIYGFGLDASTISKITDKIMPEIEEFHTRRLDKMYATIFIDGIRFKTREEGYSKEVSVYVVMGIKMDGIKEVLGYYIGESETSKYWLTVLNDLKNRGVERILIIALDNLPGISKAIKAAFPKTEIQKCIVHQIRNSTKHVNYKDLKDFCKDMKKIYKAINLEQALQNLEHFEEKWNSKYAYAIKSWRNNIEELTTYFNYPTEIRMLIYTTNPIENLNRTIRKYTKNKGSFPSQKSLDKSVFLAIQQAIKKWNTPIRNWGIILNQLTIIFNLNI